MPSTYLVFGDLHGRVLPAFRLATVWAREHREPLAGLLQVGDLGYFPDPSRLDKATRRFAARDSFELGASLITAPNPEADAVFHQDHAPAGMWFTQGNHEDFGLLDSLASSAASGPDSFPVDYYRRVVCVRDGQVDTLPGGLRVGALWGVHPSGRYEKKLTQGGRIRERCSWQLAFSHFDVLLTHDAPRHFVYANAGSELISAVINQAQPAFAFFGHYHPDRIIRRRVGRTEVAHLHGFELRGPGGSAEEGSVGVLRWSGDNGGFEYVDPAWLKTFTRHNWMHR